MLPVPALPLPTAIRRTAFAGPFVPSDRRTRRHAQALRAFTLLLVCCMAACTLRPASFDLAAARRRGDLASTEVPGTARVERGTPVREVRFQSTSWDNGVARPISIHAIVAVPPGVYPSHSKPALVFAHGLGAQADRQTAIDLCLTLGVVALSLSGPGLGHSQGRAVTPQDPSQLFAGEDDIRRNWMYAYVFAILRSITFLQTMTEVDPDAIAVTGFSLGGVATFIANGVDDRIRGAVPMAASGGLPAAAAQDTWLRKLIQSAADQKSAQRAAEGRSAASPQQPAAPTDPIADAGVQALFRGLDPLIFARKQKGTVYMLIGAQDEYFPLPQALATFAAIPGHDKRLAVLADYDHGWYFGGGCPARCMPGAPDRTECPPAPICPPACPAGTQPPYCGPQASYNRQSDFSDRWLLLLRALLANHVAPRRSSATVPPPPPPPSIEQAAAQLHITASPTAAAVRLAISRDCGYTYSQASLTKSPDGRYHALLPAATDPRRMIAIVEEEGPAGAVSTTTQLPAVPCTSPLRPFGPRPEGG